MKIGLIDITREARSRRFEAAALRYDGLKMREIGERMGIGVARASQLARSGECTMASYFSSLNQCAEIIARGALPRPAETQ